MKYPKYTRKQSLNCKLSEVDLMNLKADFLTGLFSERKLAKKYNIHRSTVRYWVKGGKEKDKIRISKRGKIKQTPQRRTELWNRKINLQPEYREYHNAIQRRIKKEKYINEKKEGAFDKRETYT